MKQVILNSFSSRVRRLLVMLGTIVVLPGALLPGLAFGQESTLRDVVISKLSGGTVQIHLVAEGLQSAPGSVSTSTPPQLSFDFFGMKSAVSSELIPVGSGAVDSVMVIAMDNHTRLVVNLLHTAEFDANIIDGDFVITIENTDIRAIGAEIEPPVFPRVPELSNAGQITRVDFRRNEKVVAG